MRPRVVTVRRGLPQTLTRGICSLRQRLRALLRGLRGFSRAYMREMRAAAARGAIPSVTIMTHAYSPPKPSQPSLFPSILLLFQNNTVSTTLSIPSQNPHNPHKHQKTVGFAEKAFLSAFDLKFLNFRSGERFWQ